MGSKVVLTIEGDASEVREQALALFLPRHAGPGIDTAPTPVSTGKSTDQPAKVGKDTAKADPKKELAKEAPKSEPEKKAEGSYTQTDIANVIPKLVSKATKAKTVELLAEFGAKNAKEVKPEQYAAFMAKANALLA